MIDKETILDCFKEPMENYHQEAINTIGNWKPLLNASVKILAGEEVMDNESPPIFLPLVKMMRLIMQITKESEWDWSNPAIQKIYREIAESQIYKMFAVATVGMVSSIIRKVNIGTLVAIGTGPGQITSSLCEVITKNKLTIPIVISDKSPSITQTGAHLRKTFPQLTINDFTWDFRDDPPGEMIGKLKQPVLLFERFCLPYGGYGTIDRIGPIADILIMVEDLNLTGKKEAYDIIYEKIGSQFFLFREVKERLEKHFPFIYTCDKKTIETINAPVTDFTLAIK